MVEQIVLPLILMKSPLLLIRVHPHSSVVSLAVSALPRVLRGESVRAIPGKPQPAALDGGRLLFGMLYRLAQAVNASYGLAVAWGYLGMFAIACMLLFVFPQVTLLLLFLGLASLALTIAGGWLVDVITRAIARHSLKADVCPRCANASGRHIDSDRPWICEHCHSEFKVGGGEITERERKRFVETPPDIVQHVVYQDEGDSDEFGEGEEWKTATR